MTNNILSKHSKHIKYKKYKYYCTIDYSLKVITLY